MKYTSGDELNTICNLVEMCESYLRLKKLIKSKKTPPHILVKHYIEERVAGQSV